MSSFFFAKSFGSVTAATADDSLLRPLLVHSLIRLFSSLGNFYFSPNRGKFYSVECDTNSIEYSKWFLLLSSWKCLRARKFQSARPPYCIENCLLYSAIRAQCQLKHPIVVLYLFEQSSSTYLRRMCSYILNEYWPWYGFSTRMYMFEIAMWFENLFTQHLDYESST